MADKKRGLGRGFDSLIPTQVVEDEFDVTAKVDTATGERVSADTVHHVAPELVDPNPQQPREYFDEVALEALAASIRVHGILQPLVATKAGNRFELIAGERRLRAAKLAGLETVPLIVRSFDEQQKLELALIENIQRAELNPIETATAYRKLTDQFNMSLADIGSRVGQARSTVSNVMRLLNLPIEAKRALVNGEIGEAMARTLLSLEHEPEKLLQLLDIVIKRHWTVRQAEAFAQGLRGKTGSQEKARARIASTSQLTMDLGDYLGTKVMQQSMAKGGRLIIEYYSDEELDRIYQAIRRAN